MRDKRNDRILENLAELRRRGALLGVEVRPLDDPGTDAFGACVGGLEINPEGLTEGVTPGGRAFAVWVPNRRREHAVLFVPETRLSDSEAEGAVRAISLMARDLLAIGEADQTMAEYCGYLGQSYENMAMVYRLVRSLGDISNTT